jgi:hypothetical protein
MPLELKIFFLIIVARLLIIYFNYQMFKIKYIIHNISFLNNHIKL